MKTEEKKDFSLEEGFGMLDRISAELEKPDLSLEERFNYYKKGMELIRLCTEKIDIVEKQMKVIQTDGSEKEID